MKLRLTEKTCEAIYPTGRETLVKQTFVPALNRSVAEAEVIEIGDAELAATLVRSGLMEDASAKPSKGKEKD